MNPSGTDLPSPWRLKDRLPEKWQRVDPQPRDLEFLRILLEQKYLTKKQIMDFIFEGKERYGRYRLWKLMRFDYVRYVPGLIPGGLYLPTSEAYQYFKGQYVDVPLPVPCPDPRTISHDLLVTNVRFLFRKLGFGSSWTSERVWRMDRSIRLWAPDAVIDIGGDSFAIEVERMQKEAVRYEDIFKRYQTDPDIVACLYLTDEKLMPLLLEKAMDYPAIYFMTIAELFEKQEKAGFRNASGRILEIEENLERNLRAEGG